MININNLNNPKIDSNLKIRLNLLMQKFEVAKNVKLNAKKAIVEEESEEVSSKVQRKKFNTFIHKFFFSEYEGGTSSF